MVIDVSGALLSAVRHGIEEHRQLLETGDIVSAKQKAVEISGMLTEMARMNPAERTRYLAMAKKWSTWTNSTKNSDSVGNKLSSDDRPSNFKISGSPTTPEMDDEFLRQIESMIQHSMVTWHDIGGLEQVKILMMETVAVAGLKRPECVKPWKGILLFGPPGTGKTLIAAAAAGSLSATFYDVKTDKLLSKYFGESSKLISALYTSARLHAPSIVFLDEFDSLSQSRDTDGTDASRKVLSSLLTAMDGLPDKKSNQLLLTLAATNTPWDLDSAILSRFSRRIYVSLPDALACKEILPHGRP